MLSAPSEPPSTGASVALGGAAPAAGAMPTRSRPSKFQILDESDLHEDGEEFRDWVDADAILASDPSPCALPPITALPSAMTLPAHATSFPLLDDDGNVIVGHQMLPVQLPAALAESSEEFGFPLGPLIWEPETAESVQICMEPEEDFLWFGSRKPALPPPSQLAREIVVPMSGVVSLPGTLTAMSASGGVRWSSPPSASPLPGQAPPSESVGSILESLRAEAALRGELEASAAFDAPSPAGLPIPRGHPAGQKPLSFADWMLSTQSPTPAAPSATAPAATVPATHPSPLPAPRRPGALPKFHAGEPVAGSPVHRPVVAEGELPHQPSLVYHRSVAPMAPVHQKEESGDSRPVTLILATLILTVALLAVAIWGNGYRTQKDIPPPWTQEPVTAKERSTAAAVREP